MIERTQRDSPPREEVVVKPADLSQSAAMPPIQAEPPLRWDLSSIFMDEKSWKREFGALNREIAKLDDCRFSSISIPRALHECLETCNVFYERLARLETFAELRSYQYTLDQRAQMMSEKCKALRSRLEGLASFIEPAILDLGWTALEGMLHDYPPLRKYRFYLENVESARAHTLSAEVEAALAAMTPQGSIAYDVYHAAVEQDLFFTPLQIDTQTVAVNHSTIDSLLESPNPETRRLAYNSYADGYLRIQSTLAAAFTGQIQSSLAEARVRRFGSTFEQLFFHQDISSTVYDAAVGSCLANQNAFQRHCALRARHFGYQRMGRHDIFAPLSSKSPKISYGDGIGMILEALTPLGDRYVDNVRRGLLDERWADVEPRQHKQSGAFSAGSHGTKPFLMLSYHGSVTAVSTLAHEVGHSVHTLMTGSTQPSCYFDYVMIVAETASNLNQVLLREHLLAKGDRELSLATLDDAFYYMHRYLFLMPILSSIERRAHDEYASGGSVSLDELHEWTREAFTAAYGSSVVCDQRRIGITWAQFSHLYEPGYTFQYIVGISAALVLGKRLRAGERGLRERYEQFLSAGASMPPADIFRIVGIDINSEDLYRSAFEEVERYNQMLNDVTNGATVKTI